MALKDIFIKTIIAGLVVVIISYVASYLMKPIFGVNLPTICKNWNNNYLMEWTLFVTGIMSGLIIMAISSIGKKKNIKWLDFSPTV